MTGLLVAGLPVIGVHCVSPGAMILYRFPEDVPTIMVALGFFVVATFWVITPVTTSVTHMLTGVSLFNGTNVASGSQPVTPVMTPNVSTSPDFVTATPVEGLFK